MKSMTGYACAGHQDAGVFASVEIKSVNSRFLDLTVNLPYGMAGCEKNVRDFFSARIQRGKVDIVLKFRDSTQPPAVLADTAAAKAYAAAITGIARALGIPDGRTTPDAILPFVLSREAVLSTAAPENRTVLPDVLASLLEDAFSAFEQARREEGAKMQADILEQAAKIEEALQEVEKNAASMEESFRENLRAKFTEVLGPLSADDERRVLQETAALLVKYTVNEETVRIRSHLDFLRREIDGNPAPGKRIDFICQELNREINTTGSKIQNVSVSRAVVAMKDAVENIREQARNIE